MENKFIFKKFYGISYFFQPYSMGFHIFFNPILWDIFFFRPYSMGKLPQNYPIWTDHSVSANLRVISPGLLLPMCECITIGS